MNDRIKPQRIADMTDRQFAQHKGELERGSAQIYDKVDAAKSRLRRALRRD
jgi:uncharacterized protein YjbJ (UPF0337 family)